MPDRIRVLQSTPAPRSTTNPYIVMLQNALAAHPGVELSVFSWRTALTGRYDVFHVHWPEILANGRTPTRRAFRRTFTMLLLLRLRLRRTAVVRTLHNVELPRGLSGTELALLRRLERLTALHITLNHHTQVPEHSPSVMIPHGHYRDWYSLYSRDSPLEGRVGFFGLVRRYKGVEGLIEVFHEALATRDDLSLVIGGAATSKDLETEIRSLTGKQERVDLELHFLSDAELVKIATGAELIVLPYRFMHNSGGALAALSLDRPILVPDNEVNRALSKEVGEGWVFTYPHELDAHTLLATLAVIQKSNRPVHPNLDGRDWSAAGEHHYEAYVTALTKNSRSGGGT